MTRAYDYYECDICGAYHAWAFNGDCRGDLTRMTYEQLGNNPRIGTMSERIEADQGIGTDETTLQAGVL